MSNLFHRFSLLLLSCLALAAQAQTDLYHRYASHSDLSVACVLDYRIDAAHTIDVAMIQAKDSASWRWVASEFNIAVLDTSLARSLDQGGNVLQTRLSAQSAPQRPLAQPLADSSLCFLGISHRDRTVWVFYFHSSDDLHCLQQHLALSDMPPCASDPSDGSSFFCFLPDDALSFPLLPLPTPCRP